ncbi:MAG: hypothetical protein OHK0032_02390 [Thermodesulfovibrionales bacterium]
MSFDRLTSTLTFGPVLWRIIPGGKIEGIKFSLREIEVLKWAKEGKTNWEISVILGISERTVKFHIASILRKLDAVSRGHAIAKALELGVLKF